jgi:hypothetical protein
MVQRVYRPEVCAYLRRHGVSSDKAMTQVLSGFDRHRPLYLQPLVRGEHYYQFVRTPDLSNLNPQVGSWFCLKGAQMGDLAVHSPSGARILGEFEVVEDVVALEGIAKEWPFGEQPSKSGIGGHGGGTQIFVPPTLRSGLRLLGHPEAA